MMRLEVASFVILFVLVHTAKGHEAHPGSCPWIPAVPHFDIEKFLGNWYSISKTPPIAPCVIYHVAGTAEQHKYILTEYSELAEDRYKYKFSGNLEVVFPNDPGKLLLEYSPNPLGYRYHVFATDYEHYAGVFVCQNFGLFHRSSIILLSRHRTLDGHYMDAMIGKLNQFKIPMGDLDLIDQQVCLHDRVPQQEIIVHTQLPHFEDHQKHEVQETVIHSQLPHFEDHQKHEVQEIIHPDVQHAVDEGNVVHSQLPHFEDHQKPEVQEIVIHTQLPHFEDHQKHEVQEIIHPDVQHAVDEGNVVHSQLPHFEDHQKPEVQEIVIHTQAPHFEDHQQHEVQEIIHPDVQHAVEEELQQVDHQQPEIQEVTEPNVELAVNEGDASLSNANADAAVGEVQGGAAITEPPVVDPVDQDVVLSIPPAEEAEAVPTTQAAQPAVPQEEVTTVISVVEPKTEHPHDHVHDHDAHQHHHQQHQKHVENNDVQKTTEAFHSGIVTAVTTDESPEIDQRIVDGTQAVQAQIGTFFPRDDEDSSPAAFETAVRTSQALDTDHDIDDTQFVQSQINTFFPHRSQHSSRAVLDTQVQVLSAKQQISTFNVEMPEPKSTDLTAEQPDAYWDNQDTVIDFIGAYAKLLALKNTNDTDQKSPSLGQVSSTMFGEIQTFTESSSPGISTNEILPNSKTRAKPTPGTHFESFAEMPQQVDTQEGLPQPGVSKPVLAVGENNEDIGIATRFGYDPGFKKPSPSGDFVFPDQAYINNDPHHRGFRDLNHGPSINHRFVPGNAYGFGRGRGHAFGRGRGHGFGYGHGHGFGYGHGHGFGYGHGHGFGHGHGHGQGFGYGHGHGHGHGFQNGHGYMHGHGFGNGFGQTHGNGFEHGHGHGHHHGYVHGHGPHNNNCHGNGHSFLDEPYVTPIHPEAEVMQPDSHQNSLNKPCTNCDLKFNLDPRIDVSDKQ